MSRALLGTLLVLSASSSPGPLHAQAVDWKGEMQGDIRHVIDFHYKRHVMDAELRAIMCLAREGDTCFGGDHEDYRCLRVVPCRTTAMMNQFKSELKRVVERRPRDHWGVAQAVYAFARLGDADTAVELGERCEAAAWWCSLVMGTAYQHAERSLFADSRFQTALLGADEELVCTLTDIGELLVGRDKATYAALPCPSPERDAFERQFWWLSDPFLAIPGNDRWTEHLTRRFELILHDRLRKVVEAPAELYVTLPGYIIDVVRRGHPDSWRPSTGGEELWTSEKAARYRFTPASPIGDGLQALAYELEATRWDEGYTPAEYGPVSELPAQFARFLEGGSMVVVGGADLRGGSVNPEQIWFLADGGPLGARYEPQLASGTRNPSFTVTVAPEPLVAAIEVFSPSGAAARVRQGLLPLRTEGLEVSDALLVDPLAGELPATREDAVRAMLPRTSAGSASEIVAYWEVYGLEAGETVEITVALREEGTGMITRVLRTLGGQAGAQAPEVSWSEPVSGPTHPMAMTVDAGQLGAGDYELQIEVTGPDGTTATAIRAVQLGER